MTSLLVANIGELVTCEPHTESSDGSPLAIVEGGAFVAEDGRITWVGRSDDAPATDERLDVGGAAVIPGFVDSHTHLVFAGDRSAEFAARMAGEPYTGGGIATTVAATRAASDEDLCAAAASRLAQMQATGTTMVEAKSGYGLDVANESRLLRLSLDFTSETTFLGAHTVPAEYAADRAGYLELVTGTMLDACRPFARWIDVFCDRGAFDEVESRTVLSAGVATGLSPRLHGNQLAHGPGARLAAEFAAASCDHCTHVTDADIAALKDAEVVATLLPAAEFSTRSPYAQARKLIDSGVRVALATDCNPGTAYVTSMPFVIALAVRELRMTPAEALLAATAGGARALRRIDRGRIAVDCSADFVVLDAPNHLHLAYRPGGQVVAQTWVNGRRVFASGS